MRKIIAIFVMVLGFIANTNAQLSLTDVLYTVGSPDIEGTVDGKIYKCRIVEMGMIDSISDRTRLKVQEVFALKIEIVGVGMIQIDPRSKTARFWFPLYRTKSDAKHHRDNMMSSKFGFLWHFTEYYSLLNDYYVSVKDYKVVTTPRPKPKPQPKKREPSIKLIKN